MDDLKSPAHLFEAQEIYSQTPEAITVAFKLLYDCQSWINSWPHASLLN